VTRCGPEERGRFPKYLELEPRDICAARQDMVGRASASQHRNDLRYQEKAVKKCLDRSSGYFEAALGAAFIFPSVDCRSMTLLSFASLHFRVTVFTGSPRSLSVVSI